MRQHMQTKRFVSCNKRFNSARLIWSEFWFNIFSWIVLKFFLPSETLLGGFNVKIKLWSFALFPSPSSEIFSSPKSCSGSGMVSPNSAKMSWRGSLWCGAILSSYFLQYSCVFRMSWNNFKNFSFKKWNKITFILSTTSGFLISVASEYSFTPYRASLFKSLDFIEKLRNSLKKKKNQNFFLSGTLITARKNVCRRLENFALASWMDLKLWRYEGSADSVDVPAAADCNNRAIRPRQVRVSDFSCSPGFKFITSKPSGAIIAGLINLNK